MPVAEIDLLEFDLHLLATQYTVRNRAGAEWTADERRRWAPEMVAVLRLVQYEIGGLPSAAELRAEIDTACQTFERRDELQLTKQQRQAWAETAHRLAMRLVATIREQSTATAWHKAEPWNVAMKEGRRVVTYKATRALARPKSPMPPRAYDPHDPRSKPKHGKL